jgi:hypothetical protein
MEVAEGLVYSEPVSGHKSLFGANLRVFAQSRPEKLRVCARFLGVFPMRANRQCAAGIRDIAGAIRERSGMVQGMRPWRGMNAIKAAMSARKLLCGPTRRKAPLGVAPAAVANPICRTDWIPEAGALPRPRGRYR